MESKENNIEEIQNIIQKSDWSSPELYILNYRKTKGGNTPAQDEDIEYDENSLE